MAAMIFIRPLQRGHCSTRSGRSNLANTVQIGAVFRAEVSPMHSARFLMHSARFLLIAVFATGIASAQTCDRACLKTTLDQYLNAVVKHDTSAAPLFVGFRQTDNGVVVRPGTWQSITALGDIQRKFSIRSAGRPRTRVDQGRSGDRHRDAAAAGRESSDYGSRVGDCSRGRQGPQRHCGRESLQPRGVHRRASSPDRTVPQNQRASREALIAIANSYFDGLTTHDGSIIMAHESCTRNENGTHTAGPNPDAGAAPGAARAVGAIARPT